jgi:transposase
MGGEPTVVERVEWIPGRFLLYRFLLETIVSKDGEHVVRAESPPGVAPGVLYGPGLHAHVVTSKCADSQPLHRISRALGRGGVHMPRSSLCSIFHRVAGRFAPIYAKLHETARSASHVNADETTLPVQDKGGCRKGWIWTCLSDKAIVYRFDASRGAVAARKLMGVAPDLGKDEDGNRLEQKLSVDGYSGYNKVDEDEGRTRCGCWGHGRRAVFESLGSAPHARELLDLINKLFKVEQEAADADELGTAKHLARRRRDSAPVLTKIYAWVAAHTGMDPPSHPLPTALTYLDNQRETLERFLHDAKVPLHNNAAERALRIIALGRKNFLFSGHEEGAQNLAVLQTVVATCLLHGVNPETYIADVLVRLGGSTEVDIDALLPWNWTQAP